MKYNEYIAPEMEIIDIEVEGSLCASKNQLMPILDDEYEDEWDS